MTQANRKASLNTNKIIVDDMETKEKLIEIGDIKKETMKSTISRLVEEEYRKIGLNK